MDSTWNRELEPLTARLLHHYRNGTTDMASEIYKVDVTQYTDEERFKVEVENIFRRRPLLLALSVELPVPGNFKKLDIADVPILLVRGRDGAIKSFMNVCRHRGAPVAIEDRGSARRFICPYHAWSYNLDGSLAGVAKERTFGHVDSDRHGLVELPCVERDGVVWGMLTPGATLDLDAHLGELGPEIAKMQLDSLHHGASRRALTGNWKLAADTYLENYHLAFLHTTTLYRATGTSNISAVDMYGVHQRMATPRKRIGELDGEDLSGKNQFDYFSLNYTIFPNTVLLITPEGVLVAQVFPGATVRESITLMEFFSARPRVTEEDEKSFAARVDVLTHAIQNEDYWMQDQVQRGLRSGANTHLTFGRNELLLHHFHTEIDQALAVTSG
ncbi:aromatic ring-hydroxylating dioxygenase subunit alpha [Nocardia vinacea]|uniref:Aromatic ring-hydroxylating dioxygenase subunit alpha n=1 Tax=Nocardia vinacea TaxID=96468 RepID=A0ABZ1YXP5_9NOCA|nr:aromatic ring-hydroxylating dioxygenase subunit alpha [Nocardia vinacea]